MQRLKCNRECKARDQNDKKLCDRYKRLGVCIKQNNPMRIEKINNKISRL